MILRFIGLHVRDPVSLTFFSVPIQCTRIEFLFNNFLLAGNESSLSRNIHFKRRVIASLFILTTDIMADGEKSSWLRHEFVLGFSHLLITKSLHSDAGCTEEIKARSASHKASI